MLQEEYFSNDTYILESSDFEPQVDPSVLHVERKGSRIAVCSFIFGLFATFCSIFVSFASVLFFLGRGSLEFANISTNLTILCGAMLASSLVLLILSLVIRKNAKEKNRQCDSTFGAVIMSNFAITAFVIAVISLTVAIVVYKCVPLN